MEILQIAKNMQQNKSKTWEFIKVLDQMGIEYEWLKFTGHWVEDTPEISRVVKSYRGNKGEALQEYKQTTKKIGEELDYNGQKWIVVWNNYIPGSPYLASKHSLVLVRE